MPEIFFKYFGIFLKSIIKFLSNKSNFLDDIIDNFKNAKMDIYKISF